jgi:hypothetical protein
MKYEESLSAKNPAWPNDARRLMAEGKAFVVVGFGFSFDKNTCEALSSEFDYLYSFDPRSGEPNEGRAFFRPKGSN